MKLIAKVHNLPTYYADYTYIVVRNVDNELWFFSAWPANRKTAAEDQAYWVGGIVLKVEE